MTPIKLIPLAAVAALALAPAAPAAPLRDCHYSLRGAFRNLTTRNVSLSCREAIGIATRILAGVSVHTRYLHADHFRTGRWDVRAHWYHDPSYPHIDGTNYQLA
jgi:hypothetical protein